MSKLRCWLEGQPASDSPGHVPRIETSALPASAIALLGLTRWTETTMTATSTGVDHHGATGCVHRAATQQCRHQSPSEQFFHIDDSGVRMVAECRSMCCNKSYRGVTTSCNARGHGSTNSSIFYHPHRHAVPSTELLGRQYGHQPVEPGLQPRHNAGLPLRIDLGPILLASHWMVTGTLQPPEPRVLARSL